jgi:hypothetical protein
MRNLGDAAARGDTMGPMQRRGAAGCGRDPYAVVRCGLVGLLLIASCMDSRPELAARDYRLWIGGEPDGFNIQEPFFSFKLEHDDRVSGWGCLYFDQCYADPHAGICAATTLTDDEHTELTRALNRATALERTSEYPCIDVPSFRFKLEVGEPGGPGNEFALQQCVDDRDIEVVLNLAAAAILRCPPP